MAQYLTVARPYAEALFEEAKADDASLHSWTQVLQVLAQAVAHDAIVQQIYDPKVTANELLNNLKDILVSLVQDSVDKLGVALENFIRLLIENNRLQVLPDLFSLYKQLVAKQQNIMNVEVSSAFELAPELQSELKTVLSKRFYSNLAVKYKVDPKLIGGVVIRTKEFVVDASIKGKLARLYHSLNS